MNIRFIGKIQMNIPFSSLGSTAIHVIIDDVVLLLKTKTEGSWSESDERRSFDEEKEKAVAKEWGEDPFQVKMEEYLTMYFEDMSTAGYKDAYLSKVFKRAVNNIYMELFYIVSPTMIVAFGLCLSLSSS